MGRGRDCSICSHPERAKIERDILNGRVYREITGEYGMSRSAISRHKLEHMPKAVQAAEQKEWVDSGTNIIQEIEELRQQAQIIKDKAEEAQDYRTALAGIREMLRIVELLAKLRGELDEAPKVNILALPQWSGVQSTLLRALQPYPEARIAAAKALEDVNEPK